MHSARQQPAARHDFKLALWGVAVIFAVLACLATWPLALDPANMSVAGAADNDVFLNQYLIFWGAHALGSEPTQLYHPNMFHPARYTFAYADMLLSSSLLMFPVIRLFENPALTYNLLLLISMVIGGTGFWMLARLLVGHDWIALAGGCLFVFNIAHFSRYRQPQHFTDHWLPWLIWCLLLWLQACDLRRPGPDGVGPTPRQPWKWATATAVLFCLQALSGSHNAVFGALLCGGITVWYAVRAAVRADRWQRDWRALAAGAVIILTIGTVVLGTAFYPYFAERELLSRQRVASGEQRQQVLEAGSAGALDLLAADSRFYAWLATTTGWPAGALGLPAAAPRGPIFPGAVILLLAALSLLPAAAQADRWRRLAAAVLDVGLIGCAAAAVRALLAGDPGLGLPTSLIWPLLALPLVTVRLRLLPQSPHAATQLFEHLGGLARRVPDLPVWLAAAIGFGLLVLGPAGGLYAILQDLPGLSLIRVPRRFVLPAAFALSVLGVHGLFFLRRRLRASRWPRLWPGVAVALALAFVVESTFAPLPLAPAPYVRLPLYDWLAQQPGDFAILELPITTNPTAATRQMIGSIWHWKKLLVGYSGSDPPGYAERMQRLARLVPTEPGLRELRQLGVRYVLVKEARLFPQRAALVHEASALRWIRTFGDTDVYELLPAP